MDENKADQTKPAPKKAAAHGHGSHATDHTLDAKLQKLKNATHTKSFKEGPHTEHHANTVFDIAVIESLKRINS